ncbi:MAG: hypothetical protein PVJ64_17405 [Gemmatimonadales bacterium]|jgi:hypothetical protein
MEHAIRRIFMFLLGVSLGYCTGFRDANNHENMVFVRMVHGVQDFAERTVGEHERAVEEAAEDVGQ